MFLPRRDETLAGEARPALARAVPGAEPATAGGPPAYDADDLRSLRALTRDLHVVKPGVFWRDLTTTSALAWTAFLAACFATPGSVAQVALALVAALAFYKGTLFIHEIAHFKTSLPGFRLAYDLLVGYHVRLPAYMGYPHMAHHASATFGTRDDPEYEDWAHRHPANVLRPLVASFFSPLVLFVRCVIVTPLHVLGPRRVREAVWERGSSVVMNLAYRRPAASASELASMRRDDLGAFVATLAFLAAVAWGSLPLAALVVHYGILVVATTLGSYRALVNHRYLSGMKRRPAHWQFSDSTAIPSGPLTGLWAPLNLNYHSVHHLLPSIPYHALEVAHARLSRHATWGRIYASTHEPSFRASLMRLHDTARSGARRRDRAATRRERMTSTRRTT